MSRGAILLAAGDHGPRLTVLPLVDALPAVDPGPVAASGTEDFWAGLILERRAAAIVCGTSDSLAGRALESAARRAAVAAGIPVAAIEDYPGNYYEVAGGRVTLLVVDSAFSARLARSRFGGDAPDILECAPIRYDPLRVRLGTLREKRGGPRSGAVLWAGQPETDDAIATLDRVAPLVAGLGRRLLFRAHPRDEGYRAGAYARLFAAGRPPVDDVTAETLDASFARRPELVLTQFSSIAVEAGFRGIPALHVLYADIGERRLFAKKGYRIPPWCEAGAAFAIRDPRDAETALERALNDDALRARTLGRFDDYFQVGAPCAAALARVLAERLRR
jgi:hypothetical protein